MMIKLSISKNYIQKDLNVSVAVHASSKETQSACYLGPVEISSFVIFLGNLKCVTIVMFVILCSHINCDL